jgi:NADPH:quinone reductase-like Zn-dependent oxidoreductase
MRAIVVTGYGGVDKLELRDVPEPAAGPGEVKVRVAFASVNPIDIKLRSGVYRQTRPLEFPAILGRDACGEVVAVGSGVASLRVGDRVLGLVDHAFAQFVVDKEGVWARLPEGMNPTQGGALPLVTLTGTQLIENAVQPKRGDVVLVTGAVGNVGRSAVYAAKALGARVIAGVRNSQRQEAERLSVEVVALDDGNAVEGLPQLDAIADTVNGATIQSLLGKVKPAGVIGSVLGETPNAKNRGLTVRPYMVHADGQRLARLAQAVLGGALSIPVAQTFALDQSREAQAVAEKSGGGKVVVRVD